jgi:glycosyltransferase involved in cell wall biosynthesis
MSRDDSLVIGERLAARLDAALHRWPDGAEASGGVLVLSGGQFAELPAARLERAVAAVVAGEPGATTSADLVALRKAVQARGAAVHVSTFATAAIADGAVVEVPLVVAAPSGDARVGQLLAAGPHSLLLDVGVDVPSVTADAPPARVCIVSFEVSGMTGGGIGTASTSLAETLARAGHDVTLLFTGWQEPDAAERNEHWRKHYAARGVRLAFARELGSSTVKNPHFPARSAYEVYAWLAGEQPFDVVHLPENMGHGAYAQLAKAQGSAFARTTFVVGTHGPTRWAAEANRVALTREEFHVNDALERTSVALADVLLGPSRYLHDYMRERGWRLPARSHVQAYAVPTAVRAAAGGSGDAATPSQLPDEIVFFGRLETRKGVATLCDALDLLAAAGDLPSFSVTFLGPVAQVLGSAADAYIEQRSEAWPWSWQIVSDRDQQGAAEYLSRPGVLAVMPSTVDNAPNTVTEAVALGIPLVGGGTGGTGELVAAEQRDDHMFAAAPSGPLAPLRLDRPVPPPAAAPLAELLRKRLTTPVEPARTPAASDAVDDAYDRWHRAVAQANRALQPADAAAGAALPSLAVCLLHDGDAALLQEQLRAFDGVGDGVELVIVDLRPDPREPIAAGDTQVVAPRDHGHAAQGRAAAVAATSGELIAFVPPGDVPLPHFAAALRQAAAATGADAYGCAVLDGRSPEAGAPSTAAAFVPLYGPALAGLTHPAFSAGPYAFRRAVLTRVGGFPRDARGDEADHELLNAIAAAGLALEVVPQPLALKRREDRWSTFRSAWPHDVVDPPYDAEQWLRAERPFAAAVDLVGLLRGSRDEAVHQRHQVLEAHRIYEERLAAQRSWIDGLERRAEEARTYEQELLDALEHQRDENARLRERNHELSQSAAKLALRSVRDAGRQVRRRIKR